MKTTLLSLAVLLAGSSFIGAQPALATNPSTVVDYEQQPTDFGLLCTVTVGYRQQYIDITTPSLTGVTHIYGVSPSSLKAEWVNGNRIRIQGDMNFWGPDPGDTIDIYLVVDYNGTYGHYRIRLVAE